MSGSGLLWLCVAGLGLLILLSAQPVGRPRPSLARRLDSLRPDRPEREQSPQVFGLPGLDALLLPGLSALGDVFLKVAAKLGLDPTTTARRLKAANEPFGPAVFWGQKIAGLIVGGLLPPILEASGIGPASGWPVWIWGASALVGFAGPDLGLNARLKVRRREMLAGLASATRLLSLAVSAGYGLEQAVAEVASSGRGPFFDELAHRISKARLESRPSVGALADLAQDADLPELAALAGALMIGSRQGVPVLGTLKAQAAAVRERWRLGLIESGERAAVTMLLPIGVLILPAFFLVVLYPAAVNLMQLSSF
ncbi:MAG: type II secretion system F family protein [Actinobacteria bacterium]|nr:type II secretion system F family protein [Actinomycetota bacterium]